jgi:hypothetical protein
MNEQAEEIEPCSEEFQDAVADEASLVQDCQLCGRTHFATHATETFYDDGELEKLRRRKEIATARGEANLYIEVDASSVAHGTITGRTAVYGCVCGWKSVRKYEDIFWLYRDAIAKYFAKRTKAALEEAQREHEAVGKIKV